MKSLIKIAAFNSKLADTLALEILKSKDFTYETAECLNVHIGHMFKCVELIWNILSEKVKNKYITLAKSEMNNSRPATSKKAALFLKMAKEEML